MTHSWRFLVPHAGGFWFWVHFSAYIWESGPTYDIPAHSPDSRLRHFCSVGLVAGGAELVGKWEVWSSQAKRVHIGVMSLGLALALVVFENLMG